MTNGGGSKCKLLVWLVGPVVLVVGLLVVGRRGREGCRRWRARSGQWCLALGLGPADRARAVGGANWLWFCICLQVAERKRCSSWRALVQGALDAAFVTRNVVEGLGAKGVVANNDG